MVNDQLELPPVWLAMAAAGAKLDRVTIQYHLNRIQHLLGKSGTCLLNPICTGDLSKHPGSLQFHASRDDIDIGMSIFNLSFPNSATASSVSASAGLYDQLMQGVTSASMDEKVKLKAAQAFKLPTNSIEIKYAAWSYHRFLAVMLGLHHPVTASFGVFVRRFESQELQMFRFFHQNLVRCAGLLRSIQIRMFNWTSHQILGDHTDIPNFGELLTAIDEDQWNPPHLPGQYMALIRPKGTPAATSPRTSNRAATGVVDRIISPAADLDLKLVPLQPKFAPFPFIEKHGHPPHNNQNGPMCLSFHVVGHCVKDCRRSGDHIRHIPAESNRLAEYLASPTIK
jgi:hypothetical protein